MHEKKRLGEKLIEAGAIPPPLPARRDTPPSPAPGDRPLSAAELLLEEEPFWGPPTASAPLATEAGLNDLVARAARGEELGARPAQLLSAMVKVLVRRGLVTHAELMDELERAGA